MANVMLQNIKLRFVSCIDELRAMMESNPRDDIMGGVWSIIDELVKTAGEMGFDYVPLREYHKCTLKNRCFHRNLEVNQPFKHFGNYRLDATHFFIEPESMYGTKEAELALIKAWGFKSSQYKHYENHEENEKLPATNFTYHIECFTINDAEMIFEALENWKAVVQARTFTGQEPEPKQNKSNFSNNHRPHGSEKNWPPTLVGVTGLCHLLQISDRQARRLLSAGKLPPAHVNLTGTLKGRRWNSEQLVKFLESHSRTS